MAIPLLLLNPYVDAILVIALGICIGGIMSALTPYIEKIPWVGGAIANAVNGMTRAIQGAASAILAPISDAVGGTFHATARLVDWTYSQFRRHAQLLLQVATLLVPIALTVDGLRSLVHRLSTSHTDQAARIKTLEREYHGIEHQVKVLEREYAGIDDTGIHRKVAKLDREVARINTKTIPQLRDRVAADEGAFAGLESWLGIDANVNYKTWAIGLTTALLGAAGLGNLLCRNFGGLLNKYACGLGKLLDDALGLLIAALALESVCAFLPLIESAFGAIAGPMVHLLNEVPLGACETPPKSFVALSVDAGPLPPAQTLGSFPS